MFFIRRRNSNDGPLCHSTPEPERARSNLPVSVFGWYRVLIFSWNRRQSINKVFLRLRRILSPLRLEPLYQHYGGEYDVAEDSGAFFTFYVNSYNTASALFRIERLDNQVWLRVSHGFPTIRINSAFRRRLELVLRGRYDPDQQRSLDLTLFQQDEALRGVFCVLAERHFMTALVEIMEEVMPELERLILDQNHISNLWGFFYMERRFPCLHSISLKNNDIKSILVLQVFQNLPLIDLNLKWNPLPNGYDQDVINIWPSLRVLNNIQLTPKLGIPDFVEKLWQLTDMNRLWCWNLLRQYNGDYNQAVLALMDMQQRGLMSFARMLYL
ncbi:nuclear RNA export factor 1 [Drosophila eugracilis]|uniref:nuclear RNA export factor 1 n=1 Tax=Drosophila eugracilis TaxID=29029 RepID=UPI0007E81D8D|nr:nuclear RNA export factor 1 [Drosophila eugracilis]